MNTVTFNKTSDEIELMAIFLNQLRILGRQFTVSEDSFNFRVKLL